jgi:hypothetical protein
MVGGYMRGKKKKIQKYFTMSTLNMFAVGFRGVPTETTGHQKGVQDLAAASTERRLAD